MSSIVSVFASCTYMPRASVRLRRLQTLLAHNLAYGKLTFASEDRRSNVKLLRQTANHSHKHAQGHSPGRCNLPAPRSFALAAAHR